MLFGPTNTNGYPIYIAVLGLRLHVVLNSTFPCLGLGLDLEPYTKSMGLSFLCLVLILAPLVSNPTL